MKGFSYNSGILSTEVIVKKQELEMVQSTPSVRICDCSATIVKLVAPQFRG